MTPRAVIHLNVADFAVAVERTVDPRLQNRPVIVAPEGAARAAVYDMSEEAYRAGVRKGMALRSAVRRCRDAVVLPPHPDRYERAMAAVVQRALPYSPLIEPGDADGHLFVDVTGTNRLFGPPVDVAWRMRRLLRKELGLSPIWSVAPSKLVAKVASRLVKPDGESVVAEGSETAFLAPVAVDLIPGLERNDLLRLREFNLSRAAHIAALTMPQLQTLFGARSHFLYEAVRGIDPSPVLPVGQKPPNITAGHEFGNDTNDPAVMERILYRLVETAGRQLRARRLAARRIGIIVDHTDGMRRARQMSAIPATANDLTLFDIARRVLALAAVRRVRIRHMRLVCGRLTFPPAQLPLFSEPRRQIEKRDKLVAALDTVRNRFGTDAIRTGRTMAA